MGKERAQYKEPTQAPCGRSRRRWNSTGGIRNTVLPFKIKICDLRNGAYGRDVEINAVGNIASSQMPGQDANRGVLACP